MTRANTSRILVPRNTRRTGSAGHETRELLRRRRERHGQSNDGAEGRPAAVIVGLDSMQGLQAARILHDRGVPVIAFAKDPKNDACRTNVCEQIRFTNTRTEDLIVELEALGRTLARKAVLFPCEDANVLLVSRHRATLEQWFHIALPPADVVAMLMDKTRFYAYAQDNGLPIPPTHFVRSRTELESACSTLTFPAILKPANSATRLWEKNCIVSAFKVTNQAELFTLYDRYHEFTDVFILQEWIAGPDSNLYSCNCYFDEHGVPLVTFVARKLRQWPPHVGKSSLGVECRADEVLHETVRLLEGVGYQGLGYVEFKLDERYGKYFIVEPNVGRPTGRSAIAEAGGVELLYTMYCDLLGLPLPADREQRYVGAKWIHERRDLQSALYYWRKGDLTLGGWLASWRGRKAHALFSLTDPGPFLSDSWRVARALLSRAERQRRRVTIGTDHTEADTVATTRAS
jgi:predicted ATP-grasp superfamily ATP-dependent carboligase